MPSQIHLLDQLMLFFFLLAAALRIGSHGLSRMQRVAQFAWTSSMICWAAGLLLSGYQNFVLWDFRFSTFAESYHPSMLVAFLACATLGSYMPWGRRHLTDRNHAN